MLNMIYKHQDRITPKSEWLKALELSQIPEGCPCDECKPKPVAAYKALTEQQLRSIDWFRPFTRGAIKLRMVKK